MQEEFTIPTQREEGLCIGSNRGRRRTDVSDGRRNGWGRLEVGVDCLADVLLHVVCVHLVDGELVLAGGKGGVVRVERREADALVETGLDVVGKVVLLRKDDAERSGVLDGLASTLRLVGHHGVRSVAEDARLLLVPVRVGLVDVQTPRLALHRVLDQLDTQRVRASSRRPRGSPRAAPLQTRNPRTGPPWGSRPRTESPGRQAQVRPRRSTSSLVTLQRVAGLRCRLDVGRDADGDARLGADAVRADDEVGVHLVAVAEGDDVRVRVDVLCNVVHDDLDGDALALGRDGRCRAASCACPGGGTCCRRCPRSFRSRASGTG
ncbi:hypothetical protein L1887_51315 [Cichorium endivia]|nr:hypothetical protein L1887_51315 [Cichorium endivia]